MANREITVRMNLDTGTFTSKLKNAGGQVVQFGGAVSNASERVKRSEAHLRSWGSGLRDVVVTVGLARHALMNLNDMVMGLPRSFIKTNAELERMKMLMVGLGGSTGTFEEAQEDAAKKVEYVYDLAKQAPFEVGAITDSFVKMKASGIDPTAGALQGLIDSVAKFGGTSEQLKRASIAIQQMAGKGVISMEELRQQLGEAVPNAILMMARALNVSMGTLTNEISKGTVEAKSALEAFSRQMTLENAGQALLLSTTWDGTIQRLSTRWIEFQKIIGEAGFYEEAKKALTEFTDVFMTSVDVKAFAHDVGSALAKMVEGIVTTTKWVIQYRDEIYQAIRVMVMLKMVLVANNLALKLFGIGWASSAAQIRVAHLASTLALTGITAVTTATRVQIGVMTVLRTGLIAVTGVFKSLSAAMLANPVGIVVAGLLVAIEIYNRFMDKQNELKRHFASEDAGFWSEEDYRKAKEQLQSLKEQRMDIIYAEKRAIHDLKSPAIGHLADKNKIKNEKTIADTKEMLLKVNKEIDEAAKNLLVFTNNKAEESARAGVRKIGETIAKEMTAVRAQYVIDLEAMRDEVDAMENLSEDEKVQEKKRRSIIRNNELIDEHVGQLRKQISAATDLLKLEKDGTVGFQNQTLVLMDLNKQLENLESMRGVVSEIVYTSGGGADDATKKLEKFASWINATKEAIAELQATADGSGTKLAELNARIASGQFTDTDMIPQAREAAIAYDELKKKVDALIDATRAYEASIIRMGKIQGILEKFDDRNATTNPWLKKEAEVKQYTVELENMLSKAREVYNLQKENGASGEKLSGVEDEIKNIEKLIEVSKDTGPKAVINGMREETIELERSLLTSREQITAQYDLLTQQARDWKAEQGKMTDAAVADYNRYYDALVRVQARMEETPIEKQFREWENSADRLQEVWAQAMDGFTNELSDALVDGKADFERFTKDILKMILKIMMQKAIAGIVGNITMGGAPVSTSSASSAPSFSAQPYEFGTFAKGGIMSEKGSLALKKYARGGIAHKPQVALFGEGSQPEAYVPLPDGRTIPVTLDQDGKKAGYSESSSAPEVHVNVINQGQPASAEQSGSRFDGEKYVVDIVMKNLNRPGPLRDTVRGGR